MDELTVVVSSTVSVSLLRITPRPTFSYQLLIFNHQLVRGKQQNEIKVLAFYYISKVLWVLSISS